MDISLYEGLCVGPQKIEYNWRDVALYALAVGAHKKDLNYVYEKQLQAIPSFGVLPYWNAIHNTPARPTPYPASIAMLRRLEKEKGERINALHMEHELILHRPIDPIKGSFVFTDTVEEIYDRGPGKGIVVKTRAPIYDEAGNLICENIASTIIFAEGGFGGEKPPKSPVFIPERQPDYEICDAMSETQNLLYRLCGDTNYIHVDPEVAKAYGYEEPFMQGLCSLGYACRMGIEAIIPGEPERLKRISAQMRNICYPGSRVRFVGWDLGGSVVFRLLNEADGKPILEKGVFEFQ